MIVTLSTVTYCVYNLTLYYDVRFLTIATGLFSVAIHTHTTPTRTLFNYIVTEAVNVPLA